MYSKYNGCGNDFILIDDRERLFPVEDRELIHRLCHRDHGIGADGLILLQNSIHADFSMHIFNSDGSEAEMCGNGVRCLVKFAEELGIKKQRYSIETMNRHLTATVFENKIGVAMGLPIDLQWHIPIEINEAIYEIHHLNTGVPHLVWFYTTANKQGAVFTSSGRRKLSEEVGKASKDGRLAASRKLTEEVNTAQKWDCYEKVNLAILGSELRNHPQFKPQGANVNIAMITPQGEIYNRTYERGVEDETLSCGTGCTAVALAAATLQGLPSPITVHTRGGTLDVSFTWENGCLTNVELIGTVSYEFSGCLDEHLVTKI